jgi:hypothetical protein
VDNVTRRALLLLCLLFAGCQTRATAPTAPEAAAPPAPVSPATPAPIDSTALVDTFEFYVPRFPETRQLGSVAYRRMTGRNGEDLLYTFSWGVHRTDHFVVADVSGDAFLLEDRTWGHSWGKFYRVDEGILWLKRYMRVGDSFSSASVMHAFWEDSCAHLKDSILYWVVTLADHRYQDVGGDLGLVEVIEVTVLDETYLYGRDRGGHGLGLVGWRDSPARGGVWEYHNTWSDVAPPSPGGCR